MEYIRIKPVTEMDCDGVISVCGGKRIEDQDSADYLYRNSVIELKLIEEEGLEKEERQQKIAAIFRAQQADTPVVVIDPNRLDEEALRKYQRCLEGPIKTALKKAAKQLTKTAERHNPAPARILVILNIGYTGVSEEEFEEICVKCARNDTRQIDMVICGGIYFHSDSDVSSTLMLLGSPSKSSLCEEMKPVKQQAVSQQQGRPAGRCGTTRTTSESSMVYFFEKYNAQFAQKFTQAELFRVEWRPSQLGCDRSPTVSGTDARNVFLP